MSCPETHLAQAERHVREIEAHIVRHREILAELERDKHARTAELARAVLRTLLQTLDVARRHVEIERTYSRRAP